jgi:hypothetical protein
VLVAFIPPVGVAVTVPPTGLPFPAPSGPVLAWVEPAAIVVTKVGAGPDAEAFPPSVFQLPSPPAVAPPAAVGAADGFIVGWVTACPVCSPFPVLPPLCWLPADPRMVVVDEIAGVAVTAAFAGDVVTATGPRAST